MELMFIPAKAEFDLKEINLSKLKKLPKKLGLVSTVQFVDELGKIKKHLDSHGFSCVIGGGILGCRVEKAEKIKAKVDAFLFIGGGMFHPLALRKLGKPIYLVNGAEVKENTNIKKNWLKFLHADKVGIIISTKPGQSHVKIAESMKKTLEKKY
ncbi:diphthamide synthesis protein, partial [Candidatus Woesearchaeota archaeon]|nr:diphthamide synthesis protein [Candidatus Woesearchaeota archaeon]